MEGRCLDHLTNEPYKCERMHLVLRHQNSYPYINAGIDLSGKANPFSAYFNSHLLGGIGRNRTDISSNTTLPCTYQSASLSHINARLSEQSTVFPICQNKGSQQAKRNSWYWRWDLNPHEIAPSAF